MKSEEKQCQNCKQKFAIEPEDFDFYEKINVPPPTFCPDCRLQRRLVFRNELSLYKRKCDLCQKEIISMFRPDAPFTVYCPPCWYSDKWDPLSYGVDYDPSRPFLQQFYELMGRVPLNALNNFYDTLVNSDYTNFVSYLKNCYLLFNSDYNENCFYGVEIESSKDCYNNLAINSCELSANDVNCQKCQRTFYSIDCEASHNVWFSKNLSGCSNCFGCVNLRNKQYCMFNEQLTKEEYEQRLSEFKTSSHAEVEKLIQQARKLWSQNPVKFIHGRFNTNVSGDYIYHSKDVRDTYIATEAQNCRYCLWLLVKPMKDCWDTTEYGDGMERVYDSVTIGNGATDVRFSFLCARNVLDVDYSFLCYGGSHMFGSVSLRKKEYCILNKEYSPEDYAKLKAQIINDTKERPYTDKKGRQYTYGEMFPIELSPFAYNETSAQQFFPLNEQETKEQGYIWLAPSTKDYKIDIKAPELPGTTEETPDDITQKTIGCLHEGKCQEQCTTAFRILPQELRFYKQFKLPMPRLCPNCRHYERLAQRNSLKLQHRVCQCSGKTSENGTYNNTATHFHGSEKCPNEFETTYSLNSPEIVYCEECYQQEVV